MRKKIQSICAIAFLACLFMFSTSNKCAAQTFIGRLESMWSISNGKPSNSIEISDGSTITVIVINGWGGQKQAQGFIHFANGNETRTSLLTVHQYTGNSISANNNEYLPYAFEGAIVWLDKKVISLTVANTGYMGTLTEVK